MAFTVPKDAPTWTDLRDGRIDLSRLAESHDGWLGSQPGPDPRGPMPAPRDRGRLPVCREDFLPAKEKPC